MSTKHWDNDRPETDEEALELLRFGAILPDPRNPENDRYIIVRTERRMKACADYFERRIRELTKTKETV